MSSLTPAYGRDYTNASDAFADFISGTKDFLFHDITSPWHGKPCSERDMRGGDRHQLRYDKQREVLVVWFENDLWYSSPTIVVAPSTEEMLKDLNHGG